MFSVQTGSKIGTDGVLALVAVLADVTPQLTHLNLNRTFQFCAHDDILSDYLMSAHISTRINQITTATAQLVCVRLQAFCPGQA